MSMPRVLFVACAIFTQFLVTSCLFVPWSRNPNTSFDEIVLPKAMVVLNKGPQGTGNEALEKYKNLSREKSLDERCSNGNMPLSIAWHMTPPYSYLAQVNKGLSLSVRGMFPSILTDMLNYCCRDGADAVKYGMFLRTPLEAEDRFSNGESANEIDFTFPIHAPSETRSFRDHPFIPLVRVPSVVLLAYDNNERTSRTHAIAATILKAWPIMVFIILTATFSGIIIWFLDHRQNPQEFPQSFLKGVWEGFWWALVTMTTVGYGDRSPKSTLGRAFCILWIVTGLVIISIFIAMVTASLSATTHPYFPIHGSVIGVVKGSEEYQLGVLMNAEMKVFSRIQHITMALLKSEIDGAFVDNFIITSHMELIKDHPIRIEKTIQHPVTYGMVLVRNSSRTEACMRRYVENFPRKVFQRIAEHLKPLKNPSDDVSQEVKAAEGLFYEEGAFKMIVYCGIAILGVLIIIGLIYEYISRKYCQNRRTKSDNPYQSVSVELRKQLPSRDQAAGIGEGDLEELLQDYKAFHDTWLERCKRLQFKVNGC